MIVILTGTERNRAEVRAAALLRPLPHERFAASEAGRALAYLRANDMFAEARGALVRDCAGLKKAERERLVAGLASVPAEATLVLAALADKPTADVTALSAAVVAAGGTVESFEKLASAELETWIGQAALRHGTTLDPRAVRYLARAFASEQEMLEQETAKAVLLAKAGVLNSQFLSELTPIENAPAAASFVDAVCARDMAGAIAELEDLLRRGESPIGLFSFLVSRFEALLVLALAQGQPELPARMAPWALGKARPYLRQWDLRALRRAYGELLVLDATLRESSRRASEARLLAAVTALCAAR